MMQDRKKMGWFVVHLRKRILNKRADRTYLLELSPWGASTNLLGLLFGDLPLLGSDNELTECI